MKSAKETKLKNVVHGPIKSVKNQRAMLLWVGLFALIGVSTLLIARAAPFSTAVEPENGSSISSGASIGDDPNASNGKYVRFVSGTTPPPAGMQFFEDFVNASSMSRFDYQLTTKANISFTCDNDPEVEVGCVPISSHYLGEHDDACHSPTTFRDIDATDLHGVNKDVSGSEVIWYCAPGDDALKGHLMTALDTPGVASISFSPKPAFTNVTKVCWDQNMNDLGAGKWLNIYVVPAANSVSYAPAGATYGLVYDAATGVGFSQAFQPVPSDGFEYTWLRGTTFAGHNAHEIAWKSYLPAGMDASSAPRYKTCLQDRGATLVIKRPDGATDTYATSSNLFPSGQVKVIFQDASYNPTKHSGFDTHLTWHWDNISVE